MGGLKPNRVRRALVWALAASLSVAALTAIAAIVAGGFDETDGRVIATSLGFAIASAVGASGAALRVRTPDGAKRMLGTATMALAALAFALFLAALWVEGAGEDTWRWVGCVALTALACSHASVVLGVARSGDGGLIRALSTASIALAALDAYLGIMAVAGVVEEFDDRYAEIVAVLVILLLLTTVLPPILRRARPATAGEPGATALTSTGAPLPPETPRDGELPLEAQVLAAADRIQALNADPGNRAPEIRRECERLRELAGRHAS